MVYIQFWQVMALITALWCGWTGPHEWSYPGMYATIGFVPTDWRSQRIREVLKGAEFARMIGVNVDLDNIIIVNSYNAVTDGFKESTELGLKKDNKAYGSHLNYTLDKKAEHLHTKYIAYKHHKDNKQKRLKDLT